MEHFDWLKGFVFPYINFILFVVIGVVAFRKPLQKIFQNRKIEYKKFYEEGLLLKQQADEKAQELETRYTNLNSEMEQIRQASKESAEQEAARIIQNAKDLASNIKSEAVRVSHAELDRAKSLLKQEILALAKAEVLKQLQNELQTSDKQMQVIGSKQKDLNDIDLSGVAK